MRRRRRRRDEKVLSPVRPNVGIQAAYRRKLDHLIEEMAASVERWVAQAYKVNEPAIAMATDEDRAGWWRIEHDTTFTAEEFGDNTIRAAEREARGEPPHRGTPRTTVYAMDATPASLMQRAIEDMVLRWNARFDKAAPQLARYFATAAHLRSDKVLMGILKRAGFTVRFKMTPVMQDVLDATIEENVGLIRSIPQKYLGEVQGAVMRSVQTGRDLGALVKDIKKIYRVTDRRAALIARDQNNKATAVMTRARQQEAGIEEAVWVHSHGGKKPRRTHLANDGKRYKVREGWFDPDPKVRRRIWPGELINCRCVPRPVVKGFT